VYGIKDYWYLEPLGVGGWFCSQCAEATMNVMTSLSYLRQFPVVQMGLLAFLIFSALIWQLIHISCYLGGNNRYHVPCVSTC